MGKVIEQKTQEIIVQLKEIRAEKGYSCQKIFDLVEASGGYVSLTTIKRVFADGSETQNFRYNETIKPIVIALLGINDSPLEEKPISVEEHEIAALKTVISIKEQISQNLLVENQRLTEESNRKHEHILALMKQSEDNMNRLHSKDRIIFWLSAGLIGLLLLVCLVLVIDLMNSDIGFIRVFSGNGPLAIAGIVAILAAIISVYVITNHSRTSTKGKSKQ